MAGTIVLIVALILMAMVLFLLEILTPSLGLLGIMGVIALIGAIIAGFSLHAAIGWTLIAGVVVLTPVYIVMLVKWLPGSSLGKRVFLGKARDGSGQGTPKAAGLEALVGSAGVTLTSLRPVGKVRIDERRLDARAESSVIAADRPVRVIDATGTEVVVREIEPAAGAAGEPPAAAPAETHADEGDTEQ